MTCRDGEECYEDIKRRRALVVLGLMLIIFILLSAFSFLGSRSRVTPDQFHVGQANADQGKRVFQAYNCMGCHTMVGNGAYLAPDLTFAYREAGPAWLAAFIPSANTWPTEAAVRMQLGNPEIAAAAGVSDMKEYFKKYPGAKARIERRKGTTLMPTLAFEAVEVTQLIAFFQYTSAINTQGWPPEVKTGTLEHRLALAKGTYDQMVLASGGVAAPIAAADNQDPVEWGKSLAQEYACVACHAPDGSRLVGPGWGGLYGSTVQLEGGGTVVADDAYLTESILDPNTKVVASYPRGVMQSYAEQLSKEEVAAIVAYLRVLEKN